MTSYIFIELIKFYRDYKDIKNGLNSIKIIVRVSITVDFFLIDLFILRHFK